MLAHEKMKTLTPTVSVVMPLYNKERDVARAISSALAQTFDDFELIVVNDGSTDRSDEVVRSITDSRIRLVEQANAGVSAARNRGITEAQAGLVAFLDADDEWLPEFLSTIVLMKQSYPECKVFATSYFIRQLSYSERPAILNGVADDFVVGILSNYFSVAAKSDPPIWSSAVAIDKEALLAIGGFPVGIKSGEDLLTWARLASCYDIAYCRSSLAVFYAPYSISQRPSRQPVMPDYVASELFELTKQAGNSRLCGILAYLALWHRMRAVYWLQLNRGREAYQEINLAKQYVGSNMRLNTLVAISSTPWIFPSLLYHIFSMFVLLKRTSQFILNNIRVNALKKLCDIRLMTRIYLCDSPLIFKMLYSMRSRYKNIITSTDTDVVIEGFPRSGNTYAYACFLVTNGYKYKIARHLHLASQIKLAVKYSIPTLVIFREPVESISSFLVRHELYSIESIMKYYIKYTRYIYENSENIVLCHFDDVVGDYEKIIKMANAKYNANYIALHENEIDKNAVNSIIDKMEKDDSREQFIRMTYVSRPNNTKTILKNKLIAKIRMPEYAVLLNECVDIYQKLLEKSKTENKKLMTMSANCGH